MDDQRTVEVLTGLVNECRSAWLTVAGSWTAVDDDAGAVLPAIASWTQHICYAAEAVRVLFTNGYGQAVHPLLRQILEHSVATAVVAKSPARYEEYFKDTWSGMRRVGEAREAVGLDQYPDAAAFLAAAEEPTSKHTSTKSRFQSLGDDGQRLYLSWLDQTQPSHANHFTAMGFLKWKDGADVPTLTDEPQWPASAVHALALILDCLTMAMDSIGSIVLDDPLGDFITTVNVRKLVAFEFLSTEQPLRPLLELMGEAGGFVPICTWWEGARLVRPYE